jgi:peptidyl-prolyl cis-trans isomerase B (cyclophilin B)
VSRPVALLFACLALLVAGCSGGGRTDKPSAGGAAATPTQDTSASNGCGKGHEPVPKAEGKIPKPTEKLDPAKTYVATVGTSCGEFQITLDAKRAPKTGGAFKYLADKKFFDGLNFHRIVNDFVIQGGDPEGTGNGGPGWQIVEAPPKNLTYDVGVVAMAKTMNDPSGASGSQFFVVTGAGAATLPPQYALLGKVTQGLDVAQKIGGIQSDPQTGQPAWPVVIDSIRVAVR